jgi:putative MATE family efflux protein
MGKYNMIKTARKGPPGNDKTVLFETMPVGKALLTMAIPTIVSQLITMIYNLADTFFIGITNDPYKVAAASVVSILFFVLTSLANLFGVGGGSLMSRLLGEKREEAAMRVGVFSIYGSLAIAIVYSLICFLFTEPLARLLGASDNTIGYASSYLFWVVVVGGIPSTIGMTMSFLLRSIGYSKESGFGLALGGVANIILDPLFMFVILPAGNEVTGAALATLFSNVISLLYFLFVYYRLRGKTILSLSPKYVRIEKKLVTGILAIGLPSALTGMLANLTHIIKNNLTSGYGDIELAAYGIVQKADMLPLNIGMGLCQGMMPLVAYNYASKNYPRMKSFTKAAQIAGMAVAGVCIVIFEIFAPQIIWLFIKDEATITFGTSFLRIACLATPFMIANFQKIYCLQAMGKGKESLILGIFRQGLFAIPIIFILNHLFQLYGIVSAQLLSDGITFIFSTLIYRSVYNKLQRNMEQR